MFVKSISLIFNERLGLMSFGLVIIRFLQSDLDSAQPYLFFVGLF